ncbi:hypothetical protein IBX35_06110 [Candidatus Bathyarchaeota archaeon]|nr:hypothetical protein [Candidatus Bathyarchaeota archaeon]
MKTKIKILAITLVIVAIASVFLYAPLTNAFQPNGDPESDVEILNDINFEARCRCRPRPRIRRAWWFLNHSKPTEVDGAAGALFKNMLIVDTSEGQIRIHLPRAWTVNGQVTMRQELFESGYLSEGETITVKVLRADVIDKQGLCVYLLLGYEIINESTVHAHAILPFNIET